MKEVAINTAVDVKLNHADMVEFLIEEQSELLENNLRDLKKDYNELMESNRNLKKEIEDQIESELDLKNNPKTKSLLAYIKANDLLLDSENIVHISWNSNGQMSYYDVKADKSLVFDCDCQPGLPKDYEKRGSLKELNDVKVYREHCLEPNDLIENPRAGITYYSYSRVNQLKVRIVARGSLDTQIQATLLQKNVLDKSFKPSRKVKALYKKLDAVSRKLSANHKEQYAVQLQLAEINCGGKRHKAKFLKAMLNQSDSGQQLLDLMKSVTTTNLLN